MNVCATGIGYNHAMAPSVSYGVRCTLLLSLCSALVAFQAPVIEQRPAREAVRSLDRVPRADIRVDTALVQIPAHVTTSIGTSVTTLNRGNFHLYEDGVEQTITEFSQEDGPI